MDAATTSDATVSVVDAVAEAATTIIAENNSQVEQSEAIVETLVEAMTDDIHQQRINEIETASLTRHAALSQEIAASIERLSQCETSLTLALERLTTVEAALATSLILQPSPNPPSVVEVVQPVVEEIAPENLPPREPEPDVLPPAAQKKRRTVLF